MVLWFVFLQMDMPSPPFGLQMCIFARSFIKVSTMTANAKGSGETALMCRLARAFAGRLCDKYFFLMCWLKLSCLAYHTD